MLIFDVDFRLKPDGLEQSACWHGRAPALRLLASIFGLSLRSKWDHSNAPVDEVSAIPFRSAPLAALAAARNHANCLLALAELTPAGTLNHSRDDADRFAAHYAAAAGATDSLKTLWELGASSTLSAADRSGRTPAHAAAEMGRTSALQALKDLGADMAAQDAKGQTPLHSAAKLGQTEAALLLATMLPKHAVDSYDTDGIRAIHIAARDNKSTVIDALHKSGADLSVQDKDGKSAAHWASAEGSQQALLSLAAAGAPLALPNSAGYSPAYVAAESQHKECLAVLAKHAPRHFGAMAGFAASAVRPKGKSYHEHRNPLQCDSRADFSQRLTWLRSIRAG